MYTITRTNEFKRSFKRCLKRGLDINEFQTVINLLIQDGRLPDKYRPHKLSARYANAWECHINPDWLLIWQQNDTDLTLLLINTGSHSDLFS